MTTRNPFPGMNPFFEQTWRDAHTTLITYARDTLQHQVPADLRVRSEERVVTIGGDQPATYVPDVQVHEPWEFKEAAAAASVSPASRSLTPAEPVRVWLDDAETERWLEVVDANGRLITVIEVFSPSNKVEYDARERYRRKRQALIGARVNVVEMDLVRQGATLFAHPVQDVLNRAQACYGICVCRATQPFEREVYPARLRDRLPAIKVPLRPTDADVVLDLQPLVDQCHERGRYHLLNYRVELSPPLAADDAVWLDRLLREHGLR